MNPVPKGRNEIAGDVSPRYASVRASESRRDERISAVPSGLVSKSSFYRGLTPTAIAYRPFGTIIAHAA